MHQQQFLIYILVNHVLIHYVVWECVRGGGIVCIFFFLLFGLLAFKLENVSVKHFEVIFACLLWFEQEKRRDFGNSNTNIWTRILNICQSLSSSCTHQWHTSVTCTRKVRVLAPYLKREQFFPLWLKLIECGKKGSSSICDSNFLPTQRNSPIPVSHDTSTSFLQSFCIFMTR